LGGTPTALSPAHEVDQKQDDYHAERCGYTDVAGTFGGLVHDSLNLAQLVF
jgi:hypothetical protein